MPMMPYEQVVRKEITDTSFSFEGQSRKTATYNIVRRCALEIEDTTLLAKFAAGDMIAIEAKYHHHF